MLREEKKKRLLLAGIADDIAEKILDHIDAAAKCGLAIDVYDVIKVLGVKDPHDIKYSYCPWCLASVERGKERDHRCEI